MSGGGQGGGSDQDKDTYSLLWILAGVAVVSAVVWHFWSAQLKYAYIILKKYELLAISFFVENQNVDQVLSFLNMAQKDVSQFTFSTASISSDFIGGYLIYPLCFILAVLAIIIFKSSAVMRYTKAYNMDMLARQEKNNWPQIAPIVDVDLIAEDIDKGPWAMSMNPMQFARHYKLLDVEMVADHKAVWKAEGVAKATLKKEKASQVFSAQLGPLWTGVEYLPPHTKALYAAFLARIEHDTDTCLKFLANLSISAAKGSMDYSETDDILKKYGKSKAAEKCLAKHAYVSTVMAAMLILARTDGVLASANFLWVKPLDRRLWYVLNNVGRQVAVPEVAGIFAHYLAEREMGRPLSVPMIDEAVNALDKALAATIYIAEEGEVIPTASSPQ